MLLNCAFITLLYGGTDAFSFVNRIGAYFFLAQNSEHDPMKNYVTDFLIFNYNLLTNQE
jgi:hypothetical protein